MLPVPLPANDEASRPWTSARADADDRRGARGARAPRSASDRQRFLEPRLAHLTPPETMKDRCEAVARIARAVRAKERICVFGDYDADGVTAAALLTDVLRRSGARSCRCWPIASTAATACPIARSLAFSTRGVAPGHVRLRLERSRAAGARSQGGRRRRRHRSPSRAGLSAAGAGLSQPAPARCGFAYKGLASVGLALSVGAGVRAELGVALDMRRWLDFVAIGTIGDVAPLDGDNRALVRAGLACSRAVGAPARGARRDRRLRGGTPTGEDVSFRLAPRINAPGRLDKPDLALALLLATSDEDARRSPPRSRQFCTRRKEVERGVLAEALAMLEARLAGRLPGIVLARRGGTRAWSASWPGASPVALRQTHRRHRARGARGRGSARAPAGFSVYDALDRVARDVLVGFGGHHAAAGVESRAGGSTFSETALPRRARPSAFPRCDPRTPTPSSRGATPRPRRGRARAIRALRAGQPGAPHRDRPIARVLGVREMRGGHLRLWIDVGGTRSPVSAPRWAPLASRLGPRARVVGALRRDTWTGGGAVEMRLVAAEPA
jgi:single-stranded-DNA-specific exonuclease